MIKRILFFVVLFIIPITASASNLNVDFTSLTDDEISGYNSIIDELQPVFEEKKCFIILPFLFLLIMLIVVI